MTTKTRSHGVFAVSFIVFFEIVYFRANSLEFARLDDLAGLMNVHTSTLLDGVFHANFQAGRLIPAVFQSVLFSLIDTVSDLQFLRYVATASVALGGAMIGLFVSSLSPQKNRTTRVLAACVGAIAVTTTSAPSATTWAILAVPLLALPLALAGGVIATSNRRYFGIPWWALSGLFVCASAFCYQQFTPLAFLPVGMWLAVQFVSDKKPDFQRAWLILGYIFASLLTNAVFVFLIGDGAQERVLGGTLNERVRWFVGTYIPRTIDVFIPATRETGMLSLLLLVIAMLTPVVLGIRYLAFMVSGVTAWAMCAVVAFPTQFWASYRLVHPAQIALWASAATGIFFVLVRLKRKSVVSFAAICVLMLAYQSQSRAWHYVSWPNHNDWTSTKCLISKNKAVNTFVVGEWNSSDSTVHSYDEYGMVPSNYDWAHDLSVRTARRELNEDGALFNLQIKPVMVSVEDSNSLADGTYLAVMPSSCR
jgi:hypothetical protein